MESTCSTSPNLLSKLSCRHQIFGIFILVSCNIVCIFFGSWISLKKLLCYFNEYTFHPHHQISQLIHIWMSLPDFLLYFLWSDPVILSPLPWLSKNSAPIPIDTIKPEKTALSYQAQILITSHMHQNLHIYISGN